MTPFNAATGNVWVIDPSTHKGLDDVVEFNNTLRKQTLSEIETLDGFNKIFTRPLISQWPKVAIFNFTERISGRF